MSCKLLKPIDILLLARPSCRTVAYCGVLRELGVYPREVIWLAGEMPFYEALLVEDASYYYSQRFFDLSLDPLEWCRGSGSVVHTVETDDPNAVEVVGLIRSSVLKDLLFSASGIVAPETLATGKRFIHVHPGQLPEYRGSTCFYYSILENGGVAATAFLMNEGIDTGEVMAGSTFSLNISIEPDQPLFMDHILDPYIRARVLSGLLRKWQNGEELSQQVDSGVKHPVCYVMHPLLRSLAVSRLNASYDSAIPCGIFEESRSEEVT